MLKKLRSNRRAMLALLVVLLPLFGIAVYMTVTQIIDPQTVDSATLAATKTALATAATAQDMTATAQDMTATAQDMTATALATTAIAQATTEISQAETATAIVATQTAILTPVSSPPTTDEFSPTIKAIFERGYLIAGVKCDFFPMGYIKDPQKPSSPENRVDCDLKPNHENNERDGFEIELMKEFAKRWLGNENAVEFKTVKNPGENIDKLTGGEVDLVAAVMTHTKERDKDISFSQTYFDDGQGLLVTDPNINSLKDLDGKSVAVLPGTTSSDNIKTEAKRLGVRIEVILLGNDDNWVNLLLENKVDAYTTDSVRLIQLSEQDDRLRFAEKPNGEAYQFSEEPYGIGVSKGDAEFRDLVNFTLQEIVLDGTYERIYEHWFGDKFIIETWPGKSYLDVNLISMQRISESREFTLGSEGSERPVVLEPFSIDQYEVTNRLYKQCVDDEECDVPQNLEQYANPGNTNHPVTGITFEQAEEYCAYVGKRLPTEDEWEAAARGDDQRIYPWDDDNNDEPTIKNANFDNIEGRTMEVIWDTSIPGRSHQNHVSPYGLHHMAGNVREWVQPLQSGEEVTRGGGWKDTAEDIKTTTRFVGVNMVADDVGFRCAVEANQFPSPLP